VNTFYGSLLVRDRTRLFVLDRREYSEITNGDQLPSILLHTSKPLISIARKYSIVATSNILSLYILVHHIMLHTSVTKEKDTT
jgi:hypothetical protein